MLAKLWGNFGAAWGETVQETKDFWLKGGWKVELRRLWRNLNTPDEPEEENDERVEELYTYIGSLEGEIEDLKDQVDDFTDTARHSIWSWRTIQIILLGLFSGLAILTPMAYVNVIVFAYPGGVVRLIAEFLAHVCAATGNCDFGYLMAGLAFALQFLLIAFGLIVIGVLPFRQTQEAD